MRHFDVAERRRRMLARHHLFDPAERIEQVAADLVGIHSTDPATVYLSLRNRIAGFTVADFDAAMYERHSMTRILGMRRTLFVVPLDLAAVIDAACTKALVANERRRTVQLMEAEGIADAPATLEAACRATLAALQAAAEPIAARSLTPAIPELQMQVTMAADKAYAARPNLTNRVCLHLSTEGHIVRARPLGSWLSSQYRWTPAARWFDPLPSIPAAEARAELVRRWLRTYGPGTTTDIAWWTKWTKRDAIGALADVGAEAVTVESATGADPVPAWALADDLDDTPAAGGPVVHLLPALDSAIMGWKERDWYLGPHAGPLFDRNGNAGPIVVVDGVAVGAWAQRAGGEVVTELLEPVPAEVADRIAAAADELTNWFAGVRVTPRFPNPLERRLANS